MSDRKLEQAAVRFLQENGFSAEFIEEAGRLTPDIRARDSQGVSYLLELKHRTVAWHEQAKVEQSLPGGIEVMMRVDPGGPSNTISGVLEKAARQLESAAAGDENVLRVVWIFANPTDRDFHYDRVRETVYGTRVIVGMGNVESPVREGMYVAPAAFARWKDTIDGILLETFGGLFLNDLSPRYAAMKGSRIAQLCGEAVLDPVEIAASGHCYYLPPDDTPPTEENVKTRLGAIYGIRVIKVIDIPRYSAATVVPDQLQGEFFQE